MGANMTKSKDPHGICIFLILYDFPLDLLRKMQPHVINTTKFDDIFTFLILYENPTTRETIFLAKINLIT